jgi:hypothetical protein
MCIKKIVAALMLASLVASCSKDIDFKPPVPQPVFWVTSVWIDGKTDVQTCTDRAAKLVVKGMSDQVWYTTGATDNFYKAKESCAHFDFNVEQLDSNFALINGNIGSVDSNCNLVLDSSVQPQDGKVIRVTAVSRAHPTQSAKLLFGCSSGNGGGGGGSPADQYVISAILLKNQQTPQELCSTTQGEVVVQGTKNGALFSTDFMSGASYESCSNFEFEVNQVNFANITTSYNIGRVDFFCHLTLNSSQSDYVQIKAKSRFGASSPATVALKCN